MDPQPANPKEITSHAQIDTHQTKEKKLMITTVTIIRKSMNNKHGNARRNTALGKLFKAIRKLTTT